MSTPPQPQLDERADRVKLELRQIGEAGADDPRLVQHELERLLPSVAGQQREPFRCEPKRPGILVRERQLALGHVREPQCAPQPIGDVAVGATSDHQGAGDHARPEQQLHRRAAGESAVIKLSSRAETGGSRSMRRFPDGSDGAPVG